MILIIIMLFIHKFTDSCSNDAFYCPTAHRCIPSYWKCDGYSDCGDDEKEFCYNHNDTNVEEEGEYVTEVYY